MRVERFNLVKDKNEYKITSKSNLLNKELNFYCLDSNIDIEYKILDKHNFKLYLKKSSNVELPVLYEIKCNYVKNDNWKNQLIQTYKSRDEKVMPMLNYCKELWIEKNKDLKYTYYDDSDCINFFKTYYDNSFVDIFNDIKQGALKCDFFRICYLYIFGGYYCDIDMKPLESFNNFIEDNVEFSSVVDSSRMNCFNAFIYSKPRHQILMDSILAFLRYNHKEIVWNVGAFGSCRDLLLAIKKEVFNSDSQKKIPLLMSGYFNDGKVKMLEEVLCGHSVYDWKVMFCGKELILSRMEEDKYDYINHRFVCEEELEHK